MGQKGPEDLFRKVKEINNLMLLNKISFASIALGLLGITVGIGGKILASATELTNLAGYVGLGLAAIGFGLSWFLDDRLISLDKDAEAYRQARKDRFKRK